MVAIITSTIFPQKATEKTKYRSTLNSEVRLEQTQETIRSLINCGISEIYLFDNSGFEWKDGTEALLYPAKIIKLSSYQFINKGLSEIYMLIHGLTILPDNQPILKISGRYSLSEIVNPDILNLYEVSAKFYQSSVSTRAIYFLNKQVMLRILTYALNNMYYQQRRISGLRSLIEAVKDYFNQDVEKNYAETSISIESGIFNAIKRLKISTYKLDKINVSGVSGFPDDNREVIYE